MGIRKPSRNTLRPSASRPAPEMPDWAWAVGQRAARARIDTIVRAMRHLGLESGDWEGLLLLGKRTVKPGIMNPHSGQGWAAPAQGLGERGIAGWSLYGQRQ